MSFHFVEDEQQSTSTQKPAFHFVEPEAGALPQGPPNLRNVITNQGGPVRMAQMDEQNRVYDNYQRAPVYAPTELPPIAQGPQAPARTPAEQQKKLTQAGINSVLQHPDVQQQRQQAIQQEWTRLGTAYLSSAAGQALLAKQQSERDRLMAQGDQMVNYVPDNSATDPAAIGQWLKQQHPQAAARIEAEAAAKFDQNLSAQLLYQNSPNYIPPQGGNGISYAQGLATSPARGALGMWGNVTEMGGAIAGSALEAVGADDLGRTARYMGGQYNDRVQEVTQHTIPRSQYSQDAHLLNPARILESVGEATPSLAMGMLAGGAGVPAQLATMFMQEASAAYVGALDEAKAAGYSEEVARAMAGDVAVRTGAINAVLEKIGIDSILTPAAKGKLGRIIASAGAAAGEGSTEALQELNQFLQMEGAGIPVEWQQALTQIAEAGLAGAGAGGMANVGAQYVEGRQLKGQLASAQQARSVRQAAQQQGQAEAPRNQPPVPPTPPVEAGQPKAMVDVATQNPELVMGLDDAQLEESLQKGTRTVLEDPQADEDIDAKIARLTALAEGAKPQEQQAAPVEQPKAVKPAPWVLPQPQAPKASENPEDLGNAFAGVMGRMQQREQAKKPQEQEASAPQFEEANGKLQPGDRVRLRTTNGGEVSGEFLRYGEGSFDNPEASVAIVRNDRGGESRVPLYRLRLTERQVQPKEQPHASVQSVPEQAVPVREEAKAEVAAKEPTDQDLIDMELARDMGGGVWKYKLNGGSRSEFTATSKEDAFQMARQAYHRTPEAERKTRQQKDVAADAERQAENERRWGKLSDAELAAELSRLEAESASHAKAAKREFNGNGYRRTGAAVSAEAARDVGADKLRLRSYIASRTPQATTEAPKTPQPAPWVKKKEEAAEAETIFKAAVKQIGTTTDPRHAGFVLSDGRMLNFHDAAGNGNRNIPHEEIGGAFPSGGRTRNIARFMELGAARVDNGMASVQIMQPLTDRQIQVIAKAMHQAPGNAFIDVGPDDALVAHAMLPETRSMSDIMETLRMANSYIGQERGDTPVDFSPSQPKVVAPAKAKKKPAPVAKPQEPVQSKQEKANEPAAEAEQAAAEPTQSRDGRESGKIPAGTVQPYQRTTPARGTAEREQFADRKTDTLSVTNLEANREALARDDDAAEDFHQTAVAVDGGPADTQLWALPENVKAMQSIGKQMEKMAEKPERFGVPEPKPRVDAYGQDRDIEKGLPAMAKKPADLLAAVGKGKAKHNTRYAFNAVLLDKKGKTVVATDGRRLYALDSKESLGTDGLQYENKGVLSPHDDPDAKFPPYKDIIPKTPVHSWRISVPDLYRYAKRADIIARDNEVTHSAVLYAAEPTTKTGMVGLMAYSEKSGAVRVGPQVDNPPVQIGINTEFLTEALEFIRRTTGAEEITFDYTAPNRPMLLTGEGAGRTARAVIMPVNLEGEEITNQFKEQVVEQKPAEPSTLDKLEAAAKAGMEKYAPDPHTMQSGVDIRSIPFVAYATAYGAVKIAKGVVKFSQWSKEMLAEIPTLAELVKQHGDKVLLRIKLASHRLAKMQPKEAAEWIKGEMELGGDEKMRDVVNRLTGIDKERGKVLSQLQALKYGYRARMRGYKEGVKEGKAIGRDAGSDQGFKEGAREGAKAGRESLQVLKAELRRIITENLPTELHGYFLRDIAEVQSLVTFRRAIARAEKLLGNHRAKEALDSLYATIGPAGKPHAPRLKPIEEPKAKTDKAPVMEVTGEIDVKEFSRQYRDTYRAVVDDLRGKSHPYINNTQQLADAIKDYYSTYSAKPYLTPEELATLADPAKMHGVSAEKVANEHPEYLALLEKALRHLAWINKQVSFITVMGKREAVDAVMDEAKASLATMPTLNVSGAKGSLRNGTMLRRLLSWTASADTLVGNAFGFDSKTYDTLVANPTQRNDDLKDDKAKYLRHIEAAYAKAGYARDTMAFERFVADEVEVTLPEAGTLNMTRAYLLGLVAFYGDPNTRQQIENAKESKIVPNHRRDDDPATLTPADYDAARAMLKPGEVELIEAFKRYNFENVKDRLFDTMLELQGYAEDMIDEVGDDVGYFPRKRRRARTPESILPTHWTQTFSLHAENAGIVKARGVSAEPFVITDFVTATEEYMDTALRIIHLAPAIRAAEAIIKNQEFKTAIKGKLGPAFYNRLESSLLDVALTSPVRPSDPLFKVASFFSSNVAKSVITLAPKVFMANTFAGTASLTDVFTAEEIAAAIPDAFKDGVEARMYETAPAMWLRYNHDALVMQYVSFATEQTIKRARLGVKESLKMIAADKWTAKHDRIMQFANALGMAEAGDKIPMRIAFLASENRIRKEMPDASPEEQRKAVRELLYNAVHRTQNDDAPLHMSGIQAAAKRNWALGMVTMFTNQSSKLGNMALRGNWKTPLLSAVIMAIIAGVYREVPKEIARLLAGAPTPPDAWERRMKNFAWDLGGQGAGNFYADSVTDTARWGTHVISTGQVTAPEFNNVAANALSKGLEALVQWGVLLAHPSKSEEVQKERFIEAAFDSAEALKLFGSPGDPYIRLARSMWKASTYDEKDLVRDERRQAREGR
jgi:hypothetical protein